MCSNLCWNSQAREQQSLLKQLHQTNLKSCSRTVRSRRPLSLFYSCWRRVLRYGAYAAAHQSSLHFLLQWDCGESWLGTEGYPWPFLVSNTNLTTWWIQVHIAGECAAMDCCMSVPLLSTTGSITVNNSSCSTHGDKSFYLLCLLLLFPCQNSMAACKLLSFWSYPQTIHVKLICLASSGPILSPQMAV